LQQVVVAGTAAVARGRWQWHMAAVAGVHVAVCGSGRVWQHVCHGVACGDSSGDSDTNGSVTMATVAV
jgi:anti-sigma factor ChrR (cupin superfamily)